MDHKTALTKKALETGIGVNIVADQEVALRIKYVGDSQSSSAYADAVLVSATSLTLSVSGVADSTVGSSGVLAFATYTTLGALVDAINLSANWEAQIIGLRADTLDSSELLARSTSTFRAHKVIELYFDSSATGRLGYLLEAAPAQMPRPDQRELYRVAFQRARALVNSSDSSTGTLTAVEVEADHDGAISTHVSETVADNSEKDTGVDAAEIHGKYGNDILVRVTFASGWADSGAYLKVSGTRQ